MSAQGAAPPVVIAGVVLAENQGTPSRFGSLAKVVTSPASALASPVLSEPPSTFAALPRGSAVWTRPQTLPTAHLVAGPLPDFLKQASRLRTEADGPRDYLIEGLVERGDVGMLLGVEGIGKTNLLTDLCVAALSGGSWCGFDVKRVERVVYVCAEGSPREIARRVRSFARGRDLDPDHIDQRLYVAMGFELEESGELDRLIAFGPESGFGVVIFDPISRMLAGDENSARDVTRAMRSAERLAQALGAFVVAVHHVSRSNEIAKRRAARGSTAFEANARFVLRCKRERRSNVLTVWISKINNAAEPPARSIVLTIDGDVSRFVAHDSCSATKTSVASSAKGLRERIIDAVRAKPGISLTALTKHLRARKADVAAEVKRLEALGVLRVDRKRGKSSHFLQAGGA